MSEDSRDETMPAAPGPKPSGVTPFPLASWLFLTLGAAHASAAAADLLPGGAGRLAGGVDASVAVAVLAGLGARRWAPLGLLQKFAQPGLVFVVALAALASGVRGAVAGHPWLGADVVLAVLASVAMPGLQSFVLALAAAELAWIASVLGGLGSVAAVNENAASWVLLSLLGGFSAASAVGLRWSHGWLRTEVDLAVRAAGRQAVSDPLTGANNRRGLERLAQPMIEHARRQGEAVHCLFLDVDDFRQVNERLGREDGDVVLRAVTEALLASIRATDVIARWSGDQFVVLGPGTGTSPLEMERRVRNQLSANPPVATDVWAGSVSIGSATLVPWDDGNLDSLLTRAEEDMNLRRSLRRQGRGRQAAARAESGRAEPGEHRGKPQGNPPAVPPVATDQP